MKAVADVQNTGKICVLDVELQGVRNIKSTHLKAKYLLIRPPTMEMLVIVFSVALMRVSCVQ